MSQYTTASPRAASSHSPSQAANSQTPSPAEHQEGRVARAIEDQTAKVPSDAFLWTAVGAGSASLALMICGKKEASMFVGQWVPTILICGLYNKLVKVAGHDRRSAESSAGER